MQTLLPRGSPDSPLRTRNTRVNEMMVEYVKGNSRLQLVNIDTGFVLTWEKVERGLVGVVRNRKSRFLLWFTISLLKRGMWLARQDLVQHNRDWGAEGVVRRVVGDLVGRIKWDMEKLGNDAAMEKWKGGLGLL